MRFARSGLPLLFAACGAAPPPVAADLEVAVPDGWQAAPVAEGELTEAWWRTLGAGDLDSLVAEALANNRDLRAAAARLEAASALAVIAGAELYPALDVGADGSRSRRNFIGFPIPGGGGQVLSSTSTSLGVNLNLTWELDLWGRVSSARSAALADVQATEADLAAAQLSIVAQTCKAYFAVVEAQRQVELAEGTVTSFQRTVEDVDDRYRRGVRPALDLQLARSNLSAAEAAVQLRREQRARAVRQLEVLLGRYPEGMLGPEAGLPDQYPDVPAGLPADLLRRRPDLVAAERRLAAADSRLDSATAALYPRLSLTASGGTASQDLEDLIDTDFRVWSLAGNLLQPLFRGGALRAEVARNRAVVEEAVAQYAGVLLRAFTEVESALAAEGLLAQRERHVREAADHSGAALQLAEERYARGLVDFLTVADTQRSSYEARSRLLSVRRERLDNRVDLFLALGGGFAAPMENVP